MSEKIINTGRHMRSGFAATLSLLGASGVTAVLVCAFAFPSLADGAGSTCPNEAARTGPSARLPECRAYEQVTPTFKDGGAPYVVGGSTADLVDSSDVVYYDLGGFGGAEGDRGATGAGYIARRMGSGWSSSAVEPPSTTALNDHFANPILDVSSTFDSVLSAAPPQTSAPQQLVFSMLEPNGTLAEIGPAFPPQAVDDLRPGQSAARMQYVGGSDDLSHIFFQLSLSTEGPDFAWPGDETTRDPASLARESLYEYSGIGNSAPTLVGVDDSGRQISQCGTALGGASIGEEGGPGSSYNAVSEDGQTVFFTAAPGSQTCGASGPPVREVYARINESSTIPISEPMLPGGAGGSCAGGEPCQHATLSSGIFEGASRSGERAFFLSEQPLVSGASASGMKLYEDRLEDVAGEPRLTEVVDVSNGAEAYGRDPEVRGVARVSEDGSQVYFVAGAVLTDSPNDRGELALQGADNLYVYDTGDGETRFIATLAPSDALDWESGDAERPAQATPSGRFLLFSSDNDLTPDAAGTDQQLYRYDDETGELTRVTVSEDGINEDGNAATTYGMVISDYAASTAGPRAVSLAEDGTVFFTSPLALTGVTELDNACLVEDEEGYCEAYANNVYEFSDGSVHLISDGQDRSLFFGTSGVELIGADESGENVYFTSADPLAPTDTDSQFDIYDARVGGGFPAGVAAPSCAEPCQAAPGAETGLATPASATLSGAGDTGAPLSAGEPHSPATRPTSRKTLARALASCRKAHRRHQRRRKECEAKARRRYGRSRPVKRHRAESEDGR